MSLPPKFTYCEDYFKEALSFFQKYKYLFNFPNTEILVRNVLQQIDDSGIVELDIFDENYDLSRQVENNGLREFFEEMKTLRAEYEVTQDDTLFEVRIDAPLSPKKKHEIVYLAKEIVEVCEKSGCAIVVDFGSGLGYLDQHIYEITNLKVLGLECNEGHYVGAKTRQRKYHTNSLVNVKYIKHNVTEVSDRKIEEYVADKFGKSHFCITGLHACADLSIDGANLFLKMADAKALVLMPCCYHKIAVVSGRFKNFPLSKCLKRIFEENHGYEYLNVPFLRLAAQPPNQDEKLEDLVFNLLARAVLQLYAHKHYCKLRRNKRKAVRTKTVEKDFSTYLQNASKGFTLIREGQPLNQSPKIETQFDGEELKVIWRETESLKTKAAIFVLLQNYLQPICENFILFDRLIYLKEQGIRNCSFKKIFNEKISPRCLALACVK